MKKIFDEVNLNGLHLKNRLIRSATWEGLADDAGHMPEKLYEIYTDLAKGGVGCIISGFTSVADNDHYFGGIARLSNDGLIAEHKRLTDIAHAENCKKCAAAGIDSIEVSGNGTSVPNIHAGVNEAYFKDFALGLTDETNVPVILVGGHRSIENMEKVLNEGRIECLSLSRPLVREPNLPQRWLDGDCSPSKCISCNMCYRTPAHECVFKFR